MAQKALRGHSHDRERGIAGAGRVPAVGRLRVRFLPLEITPALATSDPPRLAHRPDPRGPPASRGTYGAPRVHAELTLGLGIGVGYNQVELLMARAGIKGLPGVKRARPRHQTSTAGDLVNRAFTRSQPNQLWVTDITEHYTREGKVYCAVVLDTHSRRVVGWSIDSTQTAALVTNALGMAISNRSPEPGTIIHSDHGVQFTLRRGACDLPAPAQHSEGRGREGESHGCATMVAHPR
ncbi:DDE-type integrase/transposase/recombinase [Nocardia sp. NPDC051750]|uniref:DDE-type integrase/transposase/recombinase n=1 Tax=Nocardia sp. NPDC051750 TaxID=3364325 RepID=UPI0037B9F1BC